MTDLGITTRNVIYAFSLNLEFPKMKPKAVLFGFMIELKENLYRLVIRINDLYTIRNRESGISIYTNYCIGNNSVNVEFILGVHFFKEANQNSLVVDEVFANELGVIIDMFLVALNSTRIYYMNNGTLPYKVFTQVVLLLMLDSTV
jgi:hypothetical protein